MFVLSTQESMRGRNPVALRSMLTLASVLGLLTPSPSFAQEPSVGIDFFERNVRPVFANACYECHGEKKQKGSLRLDSVAAILAGGDSGPIVAPGKPKESRLITAISYDDDDLQMPPKSQLADSQIANLTRWVEMGAPMPEASSTDSPAPAREGFHISENDRNHWAFQPVLRPAPPQVKNTDWPDNPIDRFVLSKLEHNGLSPNETAQKRVLLRRAAYDLTGLPPTTELTESFLADDSPNAWRRVINQLLESPHYGEKWARHWLDLVRYAESNSYERDNPKPHAWRYRDYVIRSFNNDKPYDEFLREQLAGDEIPESGIDGIIATGYYRLGIWDDEPVDRDLAFYDGLDDIIMTTSQTMLGLTLDCARCHDHKIDPLSQADYYKFAAFFRNINHFRNGGPTDEIPLFASTEHRQKYEQQVKALQQERNEVQKSVSDLEKLFRENYLQGSTAPHADLDNLTFKFYRDTWDSLPDFSMLKPEEAGTVEVPLFDISKRSRNEAFGYVFEGVLIVPEDAEYTFYLDSDDGSRLAIDQKVLLEHDGVHRLGTEKSKTIQLAAGRVPITLEYFQKQNELGLRVSWSSASFSKRSLSQTNRDERKAELSGDFRKLVREQGAAVLGDDKYEELKRAYGNLERLKRKRIPVNKALAISEPGPTPPATHILLRGNPGVPGDEVDPGYPTVLNFAPPSLPSPPKDASSSQRRLTLANWIASDENQLTARVMVNRIWQHHFGKGIVRSPNDFGVQGTRPTHPELLDWLASEFMENGWSIKHLHHLIMTSKTYQMSSDFHEEAYATDPENELLWRFNMRRLTAEEIRDSILVLNGTFNPKMYGPSIYVDIPKAVMATQSRPGHNWGKSPPEEQARRSIYIHVKRSLMTPILQSFDVAETDRTTPVRFNSVQPTQALGMLNSEYLNEQAVLFRKRIQAEASASLEKQIGYAISLATSRPATEMEIASSTRLIRELEQDLSVDRSLALDYFCLMVMNLNEFIYLD